MVKGYVAVWMIGIIAVIATCLTGNMTQLVAVVFGFLSFGTVFMGMIGVLPTTVHQAGQSTRH